MSKSEYKNMMRTLYRQMDKVQRMTESQVCEYMDCESKEEGLLMIQEAIDMYEFIGYKK